MFVIHIFLNQSYDLISTRAVLSETTDHSSTTTWIWTLSVTNKTADLNLKSPKSWQKEFEWPRLISSLCFVWQTPVEDVPLAIAPFQGRVLVGVGKLLRIYDLGKKKLLRKCENKVRQKPKYQIWWYYLLPMNPFTCGLFQTGAFWAFTVFSCLCFNLFKTCYWHQIQNWHVFWKIYKVDGCVYTAFNWEYLQKDESYRILFQTAEL